MKYTIKYEKMEDPENVSIILIPINETIEFGDSYGDQFGIDKETNSLWISSYFNEEDLNMMVNSEVDDFFREYFKEHVSVKGFVRRVIS